MKKLGCFIKLLAAFTAMIGIGFLLPDKPKVQTASSSALTGEKLVQRDQEFNRGLESKESRLIDYINSKFGDKKIYVKKDWQLLSFKQRSYKAKEWFEMVAKADIDGSGHHEIFILDSSNGFAKIETGKGLWVTSNLGVWYLNRDWKTQGLEIGWERRDAAMWDESRN